VVFSGLVFVLGSARDRSRILTLTLTITVIRWSGNVQRSCYCDGHAGADKSACHHRPFDSEVDGFRLSRVQPHRRATGSQGAVESICQ
jgi:hypothetical protein